MVYSSKLDFRSKDATILSAVNQVTRKMYPPPAPPKKGCSVLSRKFRGRPVTMKVIPGCIKTKGKCRKHICGSKDNIKTYWQAIWVSQFAGRGVISCLCFFLFWYQFCMFLYVISYLCYFPWWASPTTTLGSELSIERMSWFLLFASGFCVCQWRVHAFSAKTQLVLWEVCCL